MGDKYIEAYYEISEILKNDQNFSVAELTDIITILPKLTSQYQKWNDVNYDGVIIDEELKNDIISIANTYKLKRAFDNRYQVLIDAIIKDIEAVTNKNKSEIKIFLQN